MPHTLTFRKLLRDDKKFTQGQRTSNWQDKNLNPPVNAELKLLTTKIEKMLEPPSLFSVVFCLPSPTLCRQKIHEELTFSTFSLASRTCRTFGRFSRVAIGYQPPRDSSQPSWSQQALCGEGALLRHSTLALFSPSWLD